MSAFEFATANRIMFGAGKLNGLADQLKGRAKRLLFVRGNSSDAILRVKEILSGQGIPFDEFALHGEPTVDTVSNGVDLALRHGADMVIGLGGGSVLDAGKAIAALTTNRGDVFDYLEVIGKGQPIVNAPLPYIAIPTTAGTGSEVTRNAVIGSPAHGVKVSLRSPMMLPMVAIVDPELTYSRQRIGHHRQHGPGRADAVDRAVRFYQSQPDDRCHLPRRDSPRGEVVAPCFSQRCGFFGARGYVAGEFVWRAGAGECRAWRCAWIRRAARRNARCAAWGALRETASAGNGGESQSVGESSCGACRNRAIC